MEKFHSAIKADVQFLSNPIDLLLRSPPVVIEQLQKMQVRKNTISDAKKTERDSRRNRISAQQSIFRRIKNWIGILLNRESQTLTDLCPNKSLSDLLQNVQLCRQKSGHKKGHLGHRIFLLWDDPSILTPELEKMYKMP